MSALRSSICSLLLVLTIWSGTAAHALETAWTASDAHASLHAEQSHEDGGDQQDSNGPHDHHGCHGQCFGMLSGVTDPGDGQLTPAPWAGAQPRAGPAVNPAQELRPPIA